MSIMGDKDRARLSTYRNAGMKKAAIDQFDGEVVQGEPLNPSGTNQSGMNFDSLTFW